LSVSTSLLPTPPDAILGVYISLLNNGRCFPTMAEMPGHSARGLDHHQKSDNPEILTTSEFTAFSDIEPFSRGGGGGNENHVWAGHCRCDCRHRSLGAGDSIACAARVA